MADIPQPPRQVGSLEEDVPSLSQYVWDLWKSLGGAGDTDSGAGAAPRGWIDGFQMSLSSGFVAVKPGLARGDADDSDIRLTEEIRKSLAPWAAGSGEGMLDTGGLRTSTWYHVFAIRNPTSSDVDLLASTSIDDPVMPEGFTAKRRIGSVRTEATSGIKPFVQYGDEFLWVTPVLDFSGTQNTARALRTLTVPTGLKVWALINYFTDDIDTAFGDIASPDMADLPPSGTAAPLNIMATSAAVLNMNAGSIIRRTNTSGQVATDATVAVFTLRIATLGWIDPRGRNAD